MKLRLKGFKGIKFGPKMDMSGPDEITIDFTGRDGISAFEGENGCGKTSVIESLSHWPQLISRSGALWQHTLLRDSEKEFEDDYMGRHYRSLVKIDAQSHKMEGYLYIDGSDVPSCNPKITEYVKKLEEIFGPSETYFRARFSPQRSKKTSEKSIDNMTPGAFRDLLREFLGLHRYENWSKTAKSAGDILSGKVGGLDGRITNLTEATDKGTDIEDFLDRARQALTIYEINKEDLQKEFAEKRQQIDTLKETISKNALALERKKDLQGQIERLEGELAKEKANAGDEIKALEEKWRDIKYSLNMTYATLAEKGKIEKAAEIQRDLENSLIILQAEIDRLTAELTEYQGKQHEKETEITALSQKVKDLGSDPEKKRIEREIADGAKALEAKKLEGRSLENDPILVKLLAQQRGIEAAAKVGDGIKADCKETACGAIAAVLDAKENLPAARAASLRRVGEVADLKDGIAKEIKAIDELLGNLEAENSKRGLEIAGAITTTEAEVKKANHDLNNVKQVVISNGELLTMKRQQIAKNRLEITTQKALADRLPEIQVAEARKTDLEKQPAEVTEQGAAKKKAWEEKSKAFGQSIMTLQGEDARLDKSLDRDADLSLSQTQKEIAEIETVKIPALDKEIQFTRDKITTLQNELTKIEAAEKELEQVRAERGALTKKISRWRYLQAECGEKGLQAHEISGAAPAIVKNANDLLMSAFDIPYTMRLKTFDEDEQKECFKVLIICPDGQEIDLDLISGGQRCWCVQALWLAMSLLKQQNSGQSFDTFFCDESDGSLDIENAVKYASLYPSFMKIARLKSLVFISHQAPARALADHTLKFGAGSPPRWE